MKRNPHDKILREKPKKQHLSTVSNSYPIYIYIYICVCVYACGGIYIYNNKNWKHNMFNCLPHFFVKIFSEVNRYD